VRVTTREISILTFILLIVLDFVFIIWNNYIINFLIVSVNRLFKVEIKPLKTKRIIFVYTKIFYFFLIFFWEWQCIFLPKESM